MEVINERAQYLLRLLVERYIRDGQPVSSKALACDGKLALSSATIRNVLSELEECGYLRSLHTSSGRIPTTQGYRLFVNNFLTYKPVDQATYTEFKQELHQNQSLPELINSASTLLSRLTQMAGLVTMPKVERNILSHVEFLPLSNHRILVVLVLNDKEIQNRIIQTERLFSRVELEQAANYMNRKFAGKNLDLIRSELLVELEADHQQLDQVITATIKMATHAFSQTKKQEEYVIAGEHHLLGFEETNITQLRQLFNAFTEKREILYLLDQCIAADGIQIFIGNEAGYEVFDNCSVITAPYHSGKDIIGVLAVVGPTRMAYDHVIPIVDITAKLLSSALA